MSKYKFTLISLFIILLAAIPLLLLSNTAKKPAPKQEVMTVTPTVAPLTTSNAEPTLTQEENNIQQSLNQADSDLQTVNSVDTTQDSTSGL